VNSGLVRSVRKALCKTRYGSMVPAVAVIPIESYCGWWLSSSVGCLIRRTFGRTALLRFSGVAVTVTVLLSTRLAVPAIAVIPASIVD
jgi:hypothetical protein